MTGDLAWSRLVCLDRDGLAALLARLRDQGFQLVGPTLSSGAIVYAELGDREDLPEGWTDEQEGGTYRLARREDSALFGYVVGPHSWKQFLFPPVLPQFRATRESLQIEPLTDPQDMPPFAFVGVRSCELAAMEVQDRVFLHGEHTDSVYQGRRQRAFILAVNCGQAGGTCFCASMNTGPRARSGFDLALTEVIRQDTHYFVTEVGSERGADALKEVPQRPAEAADLAAAEKISARAALQMGRELGTTDIRELLYRSLDHPRWDDVAKRCLGCANCTMVCPTCFCSTVEDVTDLTGMEARRRRVWDSCFTVDFSYLHGGAVRTSIKARYRQWLTHKLATWIDQFGLSGCVGCGRCITWCPVAIDLTEEVRAIRSSEVRTSPAPDKESVHGDS